MFGGNRNSARGVQTGKDASKRSTFMSEYSAWLMDIARLRIACSSCSLAQLCLPFSLSARDVSALDGIVQRRRLIHRRQFLYRAGEPFHAIYAVRSGALKTNHLTAHGEEQITGFHLPGEILGWDAITTWSHPCAAVAVETASVCVLPFERLEGLAREIPSLQRQVLRLMSREIFHDHEALVATARRPAEERVAAVLLSFSERFARLGRSATALRLPMTRGELSNYLGLVPETLSRVIRRFQQRGLLEASGHEVTLHDLDGLWRLVGDTGDVRRHSQRG